MADEAPIDIVYTWVDDRFPGYAEQLRQYAQKPQDLNPNRTRDNLDLLRYSLRSLAANCSWHGNVHIVTCRPQIPAWLDAAAEGLRIVHHDAIGEPRFLPTFNSFAILSWLHNIEGLSRRFLYVEDDMLFGSPVRRDDFEDHDGRLRLYPRLGLTRSAPARNNEDLSPWNAALAHSNALLDAAFKPARRRGVNHLPLLIDRDWWQEMTDRWSEDLLRTRASRFRAADNVVPEYLYPYFLFYTGRAVLGSLAGTYRDTAYVPLENTPLTSWFGLSRVRAPRPKFIALNDGFGSRPRARVVRAARRFLETAFPAKSRFER